MRKLLVLAACIAAALAGDAAAHRSNATNVRLQIYSNWPAPRTFLGCFNCAPSDPDSFWNPASRYGWGNPDGIWSQRAFRHADYRHLVCEMPLTAAPPGVFDQFYDFYYVLTVDAVRRAGVCALGGAPKACAAVRTLCAAPATSGGGASPGGAVDRPATRR
jgi:hypothetical protein